MERSEVWAEEDDHCALYLEYGRIQEHEHCELLLCGECGAVAWFAARA